jgi:tripartite ATP-independent transporter DctM subunit
MEWWMSLGLILGALAFLFALGIPVGFAFLFVLLIGNIIMMGTDSFYLFTLTSVETSLSFSYIAIPLFVFMGAYFFETGMVRYLYDAVDAFLGRVKARLCFIAIIGGGIFGALCGSALAGTAVFGKLLAQHMEDQGYDGRLIAGSIVSGGTLAMLIPPSLVAVILGTQANISVAKLLISGVVPGTCLVLGYCILCWLLTVIKPTVCHDTEFKRIPATQRLMRIGMLAPFGLIVFLVTGIIYIGIATPSEAAGVACLAVVLLSLCYLRRKFSLATIKIPTMASVQTTALCMLIIVCAVGYARLIAFTGAAEGFTETLYRLRITPLKAMITIQLIVLFLGMWLDSVSIIVLIAPLVAPVIKATGIDPIWFGSVTLVNLLLGAKSPPFGLCLFVLKGVYPKLTMSQIYQGVIPFLAIDGFLIALMIAFPKFFLFLPNCVK